MAAVGAEVGLAATVALLLFPFWDDDPEMFKVGINEGSADGTNEGAPVGAEKLQAGRRRFSTLVQFTAVVLHALPVQPGRRIQSRQFCSPSDLLIGCRGGAAGGAWHSEAESPGQPLRRAAPPRRTGTASGSK